MNSKTKLRPVPRATFDLDAPQWYLNRELTWLEFNRRVLHEAEDERTPLLERVKFLAIVNANLDEFFMKRIGGLKQQIGAGVRERTVDGSTPAQQIEACYALVRELSETMWPLAQRLYRRLANEGIHIKAYAELSAEQQTALHDYYRENIVPLLTPLSMDAAHPFPFVSNLSLNLLVTVRDPDQEKSAMARIKVPAGFGVPRFLRVASGVGDKGDEVFVALEDLIAQHLELLFPDMVIEACELFRVTRNAITEKDEEKSADLLELIEAELRERKFAPLVRLQVHQDMPAQHRTLLSQQLGLDEAADVFEAKGLLAMRDLVEIAALDRPELHDPPHHPLDHPKLLGRTSLFDAIREQGSILLHHPYDSFASSVERFVEEACQDPKVVAIKMTLYRTSADSKIIDALIEAAHRSKQIAVSVELKARFDESANIRWANRLEEEGIHVIYGVVGLKTHSKVILVVRQDPDRLRCYAHIGTGNYHAGTARLYADLGLLTCDLDLGRDLVELFNYLTTGFVPKRRYRKLLPSPRLLKDALLAKIEREIEHQGKGANGLIQFKMNALEDADITKALYRASQAGVEVALIVRDTCRLRPGIAGLSDKVTVISVVGRFLEHARIYYFRNGGEEEYFIGSADCMQRNLESRVEAVAPVEDATLRAQLREILDVQFDNRRSVWDMHSDGSYRQRIAEAGDDPRGAQEIMIDAARQRHTEALRLLRREPKSLGLARRAN